MLIFNLDDYSIRICKEFIVELFEEVNNEINVIVRIPFEKETYYDLRFKGDTYSVFGKHDSMSFIRSVRKDGDNILISGNIKKYEKGEI